MHAFFELIEHGFTTFDCGDIYTGVEEFLGTLVARLKRGEGPVSADDIQIHTKYVPDLDILADVTFKHTESIIDRSLRRLNRDTLDLVQFHWWDYNVPGYVEVAHDLLKLAEDIDYDYLLTAEDVRACFACAHNSLDPDGLFLFDVNTPYKFSHIYSDNAYVLEDTLPDDGGTDSRTDGELGRDAERGGRNVFCGWQNDFDAESGRCLFRLSLFEETEDGRYERADEEQEEQCYDRQTLEALLTGTGFEVLGCFGDLHFGAPDERTPRWYFVARCKK